MDQLHGVLGQPVRLLIVGPRVLLHGLVQRLHLEFLQRVGQQTHDRGLIVRLEHDSGVTKPQYVSSE